MNFLYTILEYIYLGYIHVFPFGYDHILFIISIFLISSNLKSGIIQCSLFTLAHSITLIISTLGLYIPNSNIIEPLISFSIVVTAIENILFDKIKLSRYILVFFFGLIHGLGFASALKETGMLQNNFLLSLISFNLGVELAQISIIMALYIFITKQFAHKSWYSIRIVLPISSVIACIAVYWTIERILAA
jgi:hypothetical protein